MAADRSQSPAYQALTPAARKVLAVIEGKIADGGGVATISLTNLAKLCGVSNSTAFHCTEADRGARLRQHRAGTTPA